LPNGQWGNETIVPKLDNYPLPAPPDGTTKLAAQDYLNTIAPGNQAAILLPPFHPAVQGTEWVIPGTPRPEETELTPDDRALEHNRRIQERQQQRPAPRPRPGRSGEPTDDELYNSVWDGGRPAGSNLTTVQVAQAQPLLQR